MVAIEEMNSTVGISASAAQHHNHICFIDARRGWYVEDQGIILHTTDGGDHWLPLNSGTTINLNSVQFLPDGKHGWAAGDKGVILHTKDGGVRWHGQSSGVTQFIQGIQFLPDCLHGWAVIAQGGMLYTSTAGFTGNTSSSCKTLSYAAYKSSPGANGAGPSVTKG